jgi:hypothetical protein
MSHQKLTGKFPTAERLAFSSQKDSPHPNKLQGEGRPFLLPSPGVRCGRKQERETMLTKIKKTKRPKPPLDATLKISPEENGCDRLLTPKEAASFLRVSESWLAKARMRGDGPPYAKLRRSIRYQEKGLIGYTTLRLRLSTSERD